MGRVVVIGSVNIDQVAVVAERPKPGETVLALDHRQLAGGKGANQAVAAARAGAQVLMVGCGRRGLSRTPDRIRNRRQPRRGAP